MIKNRVQSKKRDVSQRIRNFNEVNLGYTVEQAISEAKRCLNCKTHPCVDGCPVHNGIPEFINKVALGDFEGAYDIIRTCHSLPAITGRVCQQELQCERNCTMAKCGDAVSIGELERFVADYHYSHTATEIDGCKGLEKVAIIGSGPSGLSCADELNKKGYKVTVFESLKKGGGILYYGIPEFCLPNSVIDREIDSLKSRGVDFVYHTTIGKDISFDELKSQGFKAIFIGGGANVANNLGLDGDNLDGVMTANDYLFEINYNNNFNIGGKSVVVIGGGNVAIDASRSAVRISNEVKILYRRTRNELPARKVEVQNAEEEGVKFEFLTAPVKVLGSGGKVCGIECIKMELSADVDGSGRKHPVPIKDSNFVIDCDTVIMATGSGANKLIANSEKELKTNDKGYIIIDEETGETSIKGVFAGGDAVLGASTVVKCMGQGKTSANGIDKYLTELRENNNDKK